MPINKHIFVGYECTDAVNFIAEISTKFSSSDVIRSHRLTTCHTPSLIFHFWGQEAKRGVKFVSEDSSPWLPISFNKTKIVIEVNDISTGKPAPAGLNVFFHVLIRRVS